MANRFLARPTLNGRPRRVWRQVGNVITEITEQVWSFADPLDKSTWPKLIEVTGRVLVTEQTSEARLEVAALAGSKYVAFSVLGETCPLCLELDGKVFLADSEEARRFSPPLHINCDCIWIEVGELEVGPMDLVTPDYLASISDLVDQHGHFTTPETKFDVLRVPAAPDGRDFTFRRAKDPETGQVRSELVWRRPRFELPGLRPDTVQTGVAEVGARAGIVDQTGGV